MRVWMMMMEEALPITDEINDDKNVNDHDDQHAPGKAFLEQFINFDRDKKGPFQYGQPPSPSNAKN